MNNLLKQELKSNFREFMIWTVLSNMLIIIAYWEFSAINDPVQMGMVFNSLPKIAKILFGLSPLGMTDIIGYAALIQNYIYFIALAYAFILGGKIIQKEIDNQTAEFLFTKPISRTKIYTLKVLVASGYLILYKILTCIVSIGYMLQIKDAFYTNAEIIKYMFLSELGLGLLMLLVFNISLSGNIYFKNKRYSLSLVGGFLAYSYFSNVLVQGVEGLNNYTIISPWRYFAMDVIVGQQLKLIYPLIIISLIIICKLVAYKRIKVKQF